ncbi:uncharacterized protein [Procambarus clarkii]|uniref:uncharacterized protein n=1 Tax=Procambarus clarkii TaxID=6728 RepID=UPI003743082D
MAAAALSGVAARERKKRYIFVNRHAPITLDLYVYMPISVALPSLLPVGGRSFSSNNLMEHDLPEGLVWDPAYQLSLSRLSSYFIHLQLPTLPCQERLICEVTADPETYSPISNMFLKELRLIYGPIKSSNVSLMWRYVSAARHGFYAPTERCAAAFPTCPLAADRIINMPLLKLWQVASSVLNLQM